MPGAYVAKPADTVASTSPPGWRTGWMFPGPWPPGYTPELTITLSASGPVNASEGTERYERSSDTESKLYDQIIYPTKEPKGDELIIRATVDGRSVMTPVTIGYSDIGDDFWGDANNYEFELEEGDRGKDVVLTVESTIFTFLANVSGETTIEIYDPVYSIVLDSVDPVDPGDPTISITATLYDNDVYETTLPDADYKLTCSAYIGAREVLVPTEVSYGMVDATFAGYRGLFTLDIDESDAGETIDFYVEGTLWGDDDEVDDSIEIEVELILPVSIVATATIDSYSLGVSSFPLMRIKSERLPSSALRRDWAQTGAFYSGYGENWYAEVSPDNLGEISSSAAVRSLSASGSFLESSNYKFTFDANEGGNATIAVTFSAAVTMSDATVHSYTYEFTIEPYGTGVEKTVVLSTISGLVTIFGERVN